jgi:hypothetical protein
VVVVVMTEGGCVRGLGLGDPICRVGDGLEDTYKKRVLPANQLKNWVGEC